MEWGIYGLPKGSPGPAMPKPSTPCGGATPETALWPFQGWPARRGGLPAAAFYPLGYPTPYGPDEYKFVLKFRQFFISPQQKESYTGTIFVLEISCREFMFIIGYAGYL
jgi:hypothetical protein